MVKEFLVQPGAGLTLGDMVKIEGDFVRAYGAREVGMRGLFDGVVIYPPSQGADGHLRVKVWINGTDQPVFNTDGLVGALRCYAREFASVSGDTGTSGMTL